MESKFLTLFPFLSLLTLLQGVVYADPATPTPVSIWEIRDQDNTIYLAGSVHLLRKEDLPIPACYYRAYRNSSHVHFELDMALISKPEMKLKMLKLGTLPTKKKLSQFLSDKTLERLHAYSASKGIPQKMIDRLKPGMVVLTLSAIAAQEMGATPDNGIEALIYQRCVRDNKSTSGLETAEFQISMFDKLDRESLEFLINQAIDDSDNSTEDIEKLLRAWRTGDSEMLDELITDQTPKGETIHELVMSERNHNWLPTIEQSIRGNQNELFVVGAGHLVGEEGVVNLLKQKGYSVQQLTSHSLLKPDTIANQAK